MGPSGHPRSLRAAAAVPREMTRADMDRVSADFVRAAGMAVEAGFDMLELHCAHGYLLSSFITPLSNQRTDEYGGSLENRLRFPLEVFRGDARGVAGGAPMSVRISATDWVDGRCHGDDAGSSRARSSTPAPTSSTSPPGRRRSTPKPVYGRMYQTPFSDRIRNEAGVPTIAVGNITDADQVNAIIAAGRADLCALARPHLTDPYWTLHAAAAFGYTAQPWPPQYLTGTATTRARARRERPPRHDAAGIGDAGRPTRDRHRRRPRDRRGDRRGARGPRRALTLMGRNADAVERHADDAAPDSRRARRGRSATSATRRR